MANKLTGGSCLAGPSNGGIRVHLKDQAKDAIYVTGTTVPTDGGAGYAKGCLFVDTDVAAGTSGLYENKGTNTSCTFALISSGGGSGVVGSLDNAYSIGRAITVDEGAVVWTDATTGALNAMSFVKTGAGSGDVVDISMDAANTGSALNLDMNLATAAAGVYIDNGAGARTGADMYVKSDSTGAHNIIDIAASGSGAAVGFNYVGSYNGSPAGQVFKVTLDANDGLDTEIMQIDTAAGARGIMFDMNFVHTDSGTTSHIFDIDVTAILDSNILDIGYSSAASTGDAISIVMGTNLAGSALVATGTGVRTDNLIKLSSDDTGAVNLVSLTHTGTMSGNIVDVQVDGAITGNVLDIDMNLGLASKAIYIDGGAGLRTADLVDVKHDGSGNVDVMNITATNTGTGAIFDINMDGNGSNAGVFNVDMNLAVAAEFLYLDVGAGTRTTNLIYIKDDDAGITSSIFVEHTGAGAIGGATDPHFLDINVNGNMAANVIDIAYATGTATGDAIKVDMGTDVSGSAITLVGAGARTDDLIKIDDSGTGSAHIFDINFTGVYTGNCLDIAYASAAATGNAINITTGTNLAGNAISITTAGARTAPVINIAGVGSDGGTDDHIIFITQSGILDSNLIQLTYDTAASTGDAIGISMGTNLAGSAITLNGTGVRTDDLVKIDDDSTGNSHIFDINMSGIYTGNVLDITYATDAATGNCIDLNMGTNVAGMAISVSSAATGTSDEGSCFDVAHTGALVAGADVVRISSTGNISSTSNLLSLVQDTGAGTAGAYALHISATGTNVEAIKVDDGKVVFDETLTVTGLATLTAGIDGALVLAGTETIAAGGTSTALSLTKTLHNIDADAGGDIFTLGDGVAGQIVICILKTATGVATITPTTFTGGTSVTLNAAGDSVMFAFQTTLGWSIIGGNSYAVV